MSSFGVGSSPRALHVAEACPHALIVTRSDRGGDEFHSFNSVSERRQVGTGSVSGADQLSKLTIKCGERLEITFGVPARQSNLNRRSVTGDGAASRKKLLGPAKLGEPHLVWIILAPLKPGLFAVNAQLQTVFAAYGNLAGP